MPWEWKQTINSKPGTSQYFESGPWDGPIAAICAQSRDMIAPELPMRAMTSLALILVLSALAGAQPSGGTNTTITAVPGIKVGHHTLTERPTGCTVIMVEGEGAAGDRKSVV